MTLARPTYGKLAFCVVDAKTNPIRQGVAKANELCMETDNAPAAEEPGQYAVA
jgi:hypothetical protein